MKGLHVRNRRHALAVLFVLPAIAVLIDAESAVGCPLDRVVSVDNKSGQKLQFNKIARQEYYSCSDDVDRRSLPPPGSGVICRGPYGDTVMEGLFIGQRVYILYHVESSSPCCAFQSSTNLADLSPTPPAWLPHKDVPDISGETSWLVNIGPNSAPWPQDTGPLGGRTFTYQGCRSEK